MEGKIYGVSSSELKRLKDFQLALKERRKNRPTMSFIAECTVSFNGSNPESLTVCSNAGHLSLGNYFTLILRNQVKSLTESDMFVIIETKDNYPVFRKVQINFQTSELKSRFVTSLGDIFEESSSSSGSEGNQDSGVGGGA